MPGRVPGKFSPAVPVARSGFSGLGRRSRKIQPAATPPARPPMCACQPIPAWGSSTVNW